jgi:cell fate regulator YaaT (PSP1 superfamily)
MARIISIKFCTAGRHYHFKPGNLELSAGDRVVVETARGRALATVVSPPEEVADEKVPEDAKSVLRKASSEDILLEKTHKNREKEAFDFCRKCIGERGMVMKLVRAEYLFDGSKIIFYFTADGRVDFRELVKELAHQFHTRIEMKQIGVRDEAKLIGGLGVCGRQLCCCTFLTEFSPVSVKMAKEQGLALNPAKISGQCGRLLCCLSYEFDTYLHLKKKLPKTGEKVTIDGKQCLIIDVNVIAQKITLRSEEGKNLTVSQQELREGRTKTPELEFPDRPEKTETLPPEKKPSLPPPTPGQSKKPRKKGPGKRPSQKPSQQSSQKPVQKHSEKPSQKPAQKPGPRPKQDQASVKDGDAAPRRKRSRPRRKPRKKTDGSSGTNDPRRET